MTFNFFHIPETDSTNAKARKLLYADAFSTDFCVVTSSQTAGRGQLGATWQSENGKNITCSFVLKNLHLPSEEQFKLSALVSLNVIQCLTNLGFYKIFLKWPNDILANNYKIAGILIETIMQHRTIHSAIIGIGLNVNQIHFEGLPKASSLKLLTGKNYNLEEVLNALANEMEKIPIQLKSRSSVEIFEKYHQLLFRNHKASMFLFPDGHMQPGIIQGVQPDGSLRILFEDELEKQFDVKQIKLLY